jgi:GT2 family glycosyltransferase
MKRNSVSIVIINYNTTELTVNCINSIVDHTKEVDYEIIMVDNHSTDLNTDEFVRKFPTVKLIKNDSNVGFARGNNIGIANSNGDYVLLLNSDTILQNNAISMVKNFLDSNSKVAVASARLEYPNGQVQHNCQRFPSIRFALFELLRFQKLFPSKKHLLFGSFFDHNSVLFPDWVWGTFFMFRRELLDKLSEKKLADNFFMYVEDMQWCMEFRKLGFEIAFIPEAKVTHLMGGSRGEKNEMMQGNLNKFMMMYYPAWKRLTIQFLNFALRFGHAS